MKYLKMLLGMGLYIVILSCVWLIYVNYIEVDVVFYSALWAAVISVVIHAVIVHLLPVLGSLSRFEKNEHLISCALIGYILAISLPTVIDRSLSFYILEKLQQRGGEIELNSFEQVFTQEFMKEYRLVDVRLTEQLESGTIQIQNGSVKLTEKGNNIASFGQMFRRNFLPKHRLLMGTYTDDLTNPFKN